MVRSTIRKAGRRVIASAGGLSERELFEARRHSLYPKQLTPRDVTNFRKQAAGIRARLSEIEKEEARWREENARWQKEEAERLRQELKNFTIPGLEKVTNPPTDDRAILAFGKHLKKAALKLPENMEIRIRDKSIGQHIQSLETVPEIVSVYGEGVEGSNASITFVKEHLGRMNPKEAERDIRQLKSGLRGETVRNALKVIRDEGAKRGVTQGLARRKSKEFNRISAEIDRVAAQLARDKEQLVFTGSKFFAQPYWRQLAGIREFNLQHNKQKERIAALERRLNGLKPRIEYLFDRVIQLSKEGGGIIQVTHRPKPR